MVCAKIIADRLIHTRSEDKIFALCDEISSIAVASYLKTALDLVESAYDSEYVDIILEYEYQLIDQSSISRDELKALVVLNKLVTKLFQDKDIDLFYRIFSAECNSSIHDQLSMILQYV